MFYVCFASDAKRSSLRNVFSMAPLSASALSTNLHRRGVSAGALGFLAIRDPRWGGVGVGGGGGGQGSSGGGVLVWVGV